MGVIVAFFRASYFARAGSGGVKYFSLNAQTFLMVNFSAQIFSWEA
jgi:hypothetical protein